MISTIIRLIRQFGLYLWNTFRRYPFTPQKRGPRLIMESALDYNEDGELESYWPEVWPKDVLLDQANMRGRAQFMAEFQNDPMPEPEEDPELKRRQDAFDRRLDRRMTPTSFRLETFDELRPSHRPKPGAFQ